MAKASLDLRKASEKAKQLLGFIQWMGMECGIEKSFKMTRERILGNRFLIGIDRKKAGPGKFLEVCKKMEMPEGFQEQFQERFPDSNLVFFGFEENEGRAIFKVYLEFWEKLKKEIRTRPDQTDPRTLHLGFKWDAEDPGAGVVDRYICHPLLPIGGILDRLSTLFGDDREAISLVTAQGIVRQGGKRLKNDSFIYLEVNEDGNPRRSFDINLYKAELRLENIGSQLENLRGNFDIPADTFQPLFHPNRRNLLGHISGGLDRRGREFFTVYYEV